jgi:hypothetical protein
LWTWKTTVSVKRSLTANCLSPCGGPDGSRNHPPRPRRGPRPSWLLLDPAGGVALDPRRTTRRTARPTRGSRRSDPFKALFIRFSTSWGCQTLPSVGDRKSSTPECCRRHSLSHGS